MAMTRSGPGRAPEEHNLGDGVFLSQQDLKAAGKRLDSILKKEQEKYKKDHDGALPELERPGEGAGKNAGEGREEEEEEEEKEEEIEISEEELNRFRKDPNAVGRTKVSLISAGTTPKIYAKSRT